MSQDERAVKEPDLGILRVPCRADYETFSDSPYFIGGGGNGGYQAANLAVLLGAARLVALGIDLRPGADGRRHNYPDHPHGLNNPDVAAFNGWQTAFRRAGPVLRDLGVEAINCSEISALGDMPGWRTAPLAEIFAA